MKEIIAVINQKGGVGKSTSVLSIGRALMLKSFKVLFIDLDAQGNLSYTMKVDTSSEFNSSEILRNQTNISHVVQNSEIGDIIASSPSLSTVDAIITDVGKEYHLKEALEEIKSDYDYILIDTPPSLGILTVNALVACTGVIIPAQADIYSLQGVTQLYNTILTVKKYCNPQLKIMGILLTRYNSRTIISREVSEMTEQAAEQFNTIVYKTKIRECTAIKESQITRTDIFTYAPNCNAALDYQSLIEEIIP